MELECFVVNHSPPEIVPGRAERDWMESFQSRFPYRCLPLTMANTTGWEILSPVTFTAIWNGGTKKEDLQITCDDDPSFDMEHIAASHFTHGVLTFHTGYLFRTPPGYGVWVQGPPNTVKDGIAPLAGLVETDWLPFPFTMNWRFTRPGMIEFKRGEPFCFINVVPLKQQDEIQPVIKHISEDPDLYNQFYNWAEMREDFNKRLMGRDPSAMKQLWQKHYFKGEKVADDGSAIPGSEDHVSRRRLKSPVIISTERKD
jgi:hypothetical protein